MANDKHGETRIQAPFPIARPIELPRRAFEVPSVRPRLAPHSTGDAKRLVVGRNISLNGKISSCDTLVVEGHVEAALTDSKTIDVTESGRFKGSAIIDNAIIGGLFEGDITVRERLVIRAGGKIRGTIRYGKLEVETGGEVTGDIRMIGPGDTE